MCTVLFSVSECSLAKRNSPVAHPSLGPRPDDPIKNERAEAHIIHAPRRTSLPVAPDPPRIGSAFATGHHVHNEVEDTVHQVTDTARDVRFSLCTRSRVGSRRDIQQVVAGARGAITYLDS